MPRLPIRYKRAHPAATAPHRSTTHAGAYDLTAAEILRSDAHALWISTGLQLEIPEGYVGLLFPRSSITNDTGLFLGNAVGLIDADYRGTVVARFQRYVSPGTADFDTYGQADYQVGERAVQLLIVAIEDLEFVESEELSTTVRGAGGFGHTGRA